MNTLSLILMALIASVVLAALAVSFLRNASHDQLYAFANMGAQAYEQGVITRLADAEVTTRYLLGKKGAADGGVAVCGAAELPLYIIEDEPEIGDPVACAALGCSNGIRIMVGSGAITEGEDIVTDAGGKVQSEAGAVAGSYFRVGKAMSTITADGDQVFVAHHKAEAVTIA